MLADIVIQFPKTPFMTGLKSATDVPLRHAAEAMAAKVAGANRFNLNRDAVMMLHTVGDSSPHRLLQAIGVCRLPYPKMWVEFAYKDRQDWTDEAVKRGLTLVTIPDSSPPSRLGFMIEQEDDEGRVMTITPIWTHTGAEVSICYMSLRLDARPDFDQTMQARAQIEAGLRMDMKDPKADQRGFLRHLKDPKEMAAAVELQGRIDTVIPDFHKAMWGAAAMAGPHMVQTMTERARFDLRAEWRFILALLTTLNSRNLISIGPMEDYAKLNKARIKQGKEPLASHREIRLSLSKVQRARASLHTGAGNAVRSASLVMGHWKVRKTGVFWWSPHARDGKGEAPAIRTYNVTG